MAEKPLEQFTLILKHEYVYPDGEHVELDRPVVTKYSHVYNDGTTHAAIVNHMLKTLGEYAIRVYSGDTE